MNAAIALIRDLDTHAADVFRAAHAYPQEAIAHLSHALEHLSAAVRAVGDSGPATAPESTTALVQWWALMRASARAAKAYPLADDCRAEIQRLGGEVKDTTAGIKWRVKGALVWNTVG